MKPGTGFWGANPKNTSKMNAKQIDFFCSSINRRVKQMNYAEEKAVREILEQTEMLDRSECRDIATILDVNDTCIESVAEDFPNCIYNIWD